MTGASTIENKAHDLALFPYIGRLDLEQAPFTVNSKGQFFFSDPDIKQYLNLVRHLTQSSNLIPVVLSPKGGGKSSLLQAFIEQSDTNSKICVIDANHASDKSYILKELSKYFDIHSETDEQSLLHLLHQEAVALYKESRYPVIAIENAQHLQDDACKLLLLLQQGIEDRTNTWHVLFFADCLEGKPPKLYNINLSEYPQLYILLIEPFTLEQTKNYIIHRLMAAGHKGECPLTEAALKYIHSQSNGLPGKINELAHSALLKLSSPGLESLSDLQPGINSASESHRRSFKKVFIGFLFALGIAVILYLQDGINAVFNFSDQPKMLVDEKNIHNVKPGATQTIEQYRAKKTLKSKPEKKIVQKKNMETKLSVNDSTDAVIQSSPTTHENTVSNEGQSQTSPLRVADKQNVSKKQTIHQDTVRTQANGNHPAIASESISPTADVVEHIQPSSLKDPHPTMVEKLLPDSVRHEDWILRQQGKYTVQLIGTIDQKIITKYIHENLDGNTLGHEIGYYLTSANGSNKHTLIYGIFSTYYQARQAITKLPKSIKSNGPWPVKLDDVKKSISLQKHAHPVIKESSEASPAQADRRSGVRASGKSAASGFIKDGGVWLAKQNPDYFTVQMISSSNQKTILDYMYKYKLQKESVLYKTTRKQKDWYVLFYGTYETRNKAKLLVNSLPKRARSNSPWIRKIGDLQKQVLTNQN